MNTLVNRNGKILSYSPCDSRIFELQRRVERTLKQDEIFKKKKLLRNIELKLNQHEQHENQPS